MVVMKRYSLPVFLLIFLFANQQSFGWGKTGHEIVAEIAIQQLSSETKGKVLAVLGDITPEHAGTWMDEMRSDHNYDYMKPWHYINIAKGQSYAPTTDENIVNQLIWTIRELKHTQTLCGPQTKTDVLELFHLIGDLHQPLHAGYGEDKGGNTIQVSFMGNGTNLHSLWDDGIIQQQHITLAGCEQLYGSLSKLEIAMVSKIDVVAWMNESREALPQVYDFDGHKIDEIYAAKNKAFIEKRLLYAGLRLAAVLENVFGGAKEVPVSHDTKTVAGAAGTITAEQAAAHVGEEVTVCGKVYGGKYLDRSNGTPTFINIGAAYPDSPFTVVIFGSDRGRFSYKPEKDLDGKMICVTGKVKEYKGKAEIIVSDEQQIKIQ